MNLLYELWNRFTIVCVNRLVNSLLDYYNWRYRYCIKSRKTLAFPTRGLEHYMVCMISYKSSVIYKRQRHLSWSVHNLILGSRFLWFYRLGSPRLVSAWFYTSEVIYVSCVHSVLQTRALLIQLIAAIGSPWLFLSFPLPRLPLPYSSCLSISAQRCIQRFPFLLSSHIRTPLSGWWTRPASYNSHASADYRGWVMCISIQVRITVRCTEQYVFAGYGCPRIDSDGHIVLPPPASFVSSPLTP